MGGLTQGERLVLLERQRQARWFVLENGKYIELEPDENGALRSRVFPGLWLLPTALFDGDKPRVRQVLQQGISSQEHQAWIVGVRR